MGLNVVTTSLLAEGTDWVAWMTRNSILQQPDPDDEKLQSDFVDSILGDQQCDGSWGAVPATAYAVLNLLALGEAPASQQIQQAAKWLLHLPEPPPRPGMWMLTESYLQEWLSRREPRERRDFAPGQFHWEPPDEDINYSCWEFPDCEQDQFRGEEMQQVIPTCARHHPPACEPRMTHSSALVAEALLLCGYADHPRVRRYINTLFHLGGEWGYWCGCAALGFMEIEAAPDRIEILERLARGDMSVDEAVKRLQQS